MHSLSLAHILENQRPVLLLHMLHMLHILHILHTSYYILHTSYFILHTTYIFRCRGCFAQTLPPPPSPPPPPPPPPVAAHWSEHTQITTTRTTDEEGAGWTSRERDEFRPEKRPGLDNSQHPPQPPQPFRLSFPLCLSPCPLLPRAWRE